MADKAGRGKQRLGQGLPPEAPLMWLATEGILLLYLATNGTRLAGRDYPAAATFVYFGYFLLPFALQSEYAKELGRHSVLEYLGKFAFGFMATLAAYYVLFVYFLQAQAAPIAYSAVFATVIFQAFVVAPVEELFFRGWIAWRLERRGKGTAHIYAGVTVGSVLSAGLFSAFHFAAFGTALEKFTLIFVLAIAWTWLSRLKVGLPFHEEKRPLGIAASAGSHAAWNLLVSGVLSFRIITGA
jgi:hypothetical protein